MSPAERVGQIMLEERQRTMTEISLLDAPDALKREVVAVLMAVQEALNKHLAARETALDARIIPTAVAGLAQELSRVYKRIADEDLTPKVAERN